MAQIVHDLKRIPDLSALQGGPLDKWPPFPKTEKENLI